MRKLYWLIVIIIVIALVYFFYPNAISYVINSIQSLIHSILPQY